MTLDRDIRRSLPSLSGRREDRRRGKGERVKWRNTENITTKSLQLTAVILCMATVTMETNDFLRSNATGEGGGGGKLTSVEVCQMETFQASCPTENQILIIQEAHLGRLRLGRCVSESFGYLNCSLDVLPELDIHCSGRSRCKVKVDDEIFKRKVPGCHMDLKNHLHVSYSCITVVLPPDGGRSSCDPIDAESGFISSQLMESTGCGQIGSPMVIQVKPGQRINITLYDFSHEDGEFSSTSATSSLFQSYPKTCRVYATLRDSPSDFRSLKVCGRHERVTNVYTSTGNRVEIRIMPGKTSARTPNGAHQNNPQFLLFFQGVGCPDIRIPEGMVKERFGNLMNVGCQGNGRSWQLTCTDNKWIGSYGNCDVDNVTVTSGMHYATSTIILVVIAAVVSSIILIIGVFCIKWKKREVDNVRRIQLSTDHYNATDYSLGTISPDKLTPESVNFSGSASGPDGTGNEYARMRFMCLPQYDVKGPPAYVVDGRYGMPVIEHIYESPDCIGRSPEGQRTYATRVHHPPASCRPPTGAVIDPLVSDPQPRVGGMTQGRTGSTNQRQENKSKTGGNYSL